MKKIIPVAIVLLAIVGFFYYKSFLVPADRAQKAEERINAETLPASAPQDEETSREVQDSSVEEITLEEALDLERRVVIGDLTLNTNEILGTRIWVCC